MVEKMRPGYKTPYSRQLAGPILDHVYGEVKRGRRKFPNCEKMLLQKKHVPLGGPHYLANMLDHRFVGERFTICRKNKLAFLTDINPFVNAITTKSKPFPKFMSE